MKENVPYHEVNSILKRRLTNHSLVSNLIKVNENHNKGKKKNETCNKTGTNTKPGKKIVKLQSLLQSHKKNKTEKNQKSKADNVTNHD